VLRAEGGVVPSLFPVNGECAVMVLDVANIQSCVGCEPSREMIDKVMSNVAWNCMDAFIDV
jgi:hypothetical protein